MNSVAIIPARGGSKRLPGKNILPFFGHPMIAYTIATAKNSGLFQEIIVSTDDPDLGWVAEWYGASYLPRPAKLATDHASLVDVALHTLKETHRTFEFVCQLMPNCPLRRSEDIIEHFSIFREQKRSFQISVMRYRSLYPHWSLSIDPAGFGKWVFGSEFLIRSQDLTDVFCPTGAIWWAKTSDFIEQSAFYGDPFFLAEIDPNRGIDIDTIDDLNLVDLLVRGLRDRDGVSPLESINSPAFGKDLQKCD
jgi:CMP-N-acetylneuraminic acid synthetase